MHLIVGEVAPVAPLLIPVGLIVMWGVFLALCLGAAYVAKAFFGTASGTLGKLPVIGGWINSSVHNVEHKLTATLGQASAYADAQIGAAFHSLARIVDYIGHEIEAHANLLAVLAQAIAGQTVGLNLWGQIGRIRHFEGALVKQISQLVRRQIAQDERIARGIGHDVLPRIKSLEREVHGEVVRERVRARAAERTVDREITNLWKWTRTHTLTAGTAAFAAAVAVAISRLGLNWIRCPSARSVFNKRGCNMWTQIDKLLGLLGEVALVTNICTVIPWVEEGFSLVAAPLVAALTDVGAGLCAPGSGPPEFLPPPELHLPAAPSAALHLP